MKNEIRSWRILLVEDNLADICLFRLALNEAGLKFELMALHDGGEALAFVKRQDDQADGPCPDLAVLDLKLPKHSGAEVLAAIRSSQYLRDMPAIVITSVASPHDTAKVEALGIERQIVKSCDFKEFLKIGEEIKGVLLKSVEVQEASGRPAAL